VALRLNALSKDTMKQRFLQFNDALYLACIWISGLSIVIMSLIIPWGIFTRYVLGTGSQWPEPISILLMVIFTFFGAAAGYRAGAHIAVGMLTDRMPEGLRKQASCAARDLAHGLDGRFHGLLWREVVHRIVGAEYQ
jgi:TRAP-type C4-dicarboxylate transport system permease small subunit